MPPKPKPKPHKDINVCQDTDEVFTYIRELRASLTTEQHDQFIKLIEKTKTELHKEVDGFTRKQAKSYDKLKELELITDKTAAQLSDIPRDYFKYKLHYVLNGIQNRLTHRIDNFTSPNISQPKPSTDAGDDENDDMDADKTVIEVHQPPVRDICTQTDLCLESELGEHATSASNTLCIENCKNKDCEDFVRCIICMAWFHPKCCDAEDELEHETAMFTCPTCRRFPQVLLAMQKQMATILGKLTALELSQRVEAAAAELHSDSTDSEVESQASNDPDPDDSVDRLLRHTPTASSHSPTPDEQSDDEASSQDDEGWITVPATKKKLKKKTKKPEAKHTVTVISDSIPKNINQDYILRKTSAKVTLVREGQDVSKVVDYIQSCAEKLRSEPIVIHTGTNNVTREHEQTTKKRLDRLEANLRHYKYEHVAMSGIVHQNSSIKVRNKINLLNEHVQMMCARNGWLYIDNDYIDSSCISHDNIHMNGMGDEILTNTMSKTIEKLLKSH